jgi:protoheme IX farnesyltransferase
MKEKIKLFFQLIKVTIILPVSFLSFVGYTLYEGKVGYSVLLVCLGVFLLAGAASVINQIIERKWDSQMERTSKRPIPSGQVSATQAWYIAIIMTLLGVIILYPFSYVCIVLGLFNLAWYIGVYTLLKRVTPFAVIPGSLTGAIPILIGYAAAGGNYDDSQAIFVAFFVFMWQIPHFWLLTLIYGKEYEAANYPTLFRVFSESQIRRWTMVWIIAACLVSLTIRHFEIVNHFSSSIIIILINSVLIILSYIFLFHRPKTSKYRIIFHLINLFMVFGLLVISFEKIGWF